MDAKKEIIKIITDMSGKQSGYEIFTDWIRCMALSISNAVTPVHGKIWKDREKYFEDTISKYTEQEQEKFAQLTGCLVLALEEGPDDVLGSVYMDAGLGSKITGQFFTPFHLSILTARLSLGNAIRSFNGNMLPIHEPSCGGGAMIIAMAKVLHDEGINYQKVMDVVAQDLDWKGVYMCYVQLSLLGIKAICVQGDTLQEPYDSKKTDRSHILLTPAKMGALI